MFKMTFSKKRQLLIFSFTFLLAKKKKMFSSGSKIINSSMFCYCSFLLPDESGQVLQKRTKKGAPKKITSLFREAAMFSFCTTVASAFDLYS